MVLEATKRVGGPGQKQGQKETHTLAQHGSPIETGETFSDRARS